MEKTENSDNVPNFMSKIEFARLCGLKSTQAVRYRIIKNIELLNELNLTDTWRTNIKLWTRKELIILKKYFGVPK